MAPLTAETGRYIYGVAGDEEIPRRRAAGCYHLTGVHTHANGQPVPKFSVVAYTFSQLQRRGQRPLRVVSMRLGKAEDGHDGIADELLEGAAVVADDFLRDHVEARQERTNILRIQRLAERGGPADVGEEDGDESPLLGRPSHRLERRTAERTEPGCLGIFLLTCRTSHGVYRQPSAAVLDALQKYPAATTTAPAVRQVYHPGPGSVPAPVSTRRRAAESSRRTGPGRPPAASRPGTIAPRPGRERACDPRRDMPSRRSTRDEPAHPAAEEPPVSIQRASSTRRGAGRRNARQTAPALR